MFNGDDNRIRRADFRSWPLAAAAFSLLFLGSALASPHAWVDQPFWNFGTVTNVDELTHAFVVRNTEINSRGEHSPSVPFFMLRFLYN